MNKYTKAALLLLLLLFFLLLGMKIEYQTQKEDEKNLETFEKVFEPSKF